MRGCSATADGLFAESFGLIQPFSGMNPDMVVSGKEK